MKKLVLALTVTLACVGAFAQGKIRFENNSLHLVYYTTDATSLLTADKASAGLGVMSGVTASGQTLTAELWGGTSSTALTTKVGTGTFTAGVEGTIAGQNITTTFAAGTPVYLQVLVYNSAAGSYAAAAAGQNLYYGSSAVFTTVPSGTIAANSIVNSTFSTWANGTWNMDNSSYGTGARGAIAVQANVPEPTSLALLGLGAAGMMIFRRRK